MSKPVEFKATMLGDMVKIPCDNHDLGDHVWLKVTDIVALGQSSVSTASDFEATFYIYTNLPLFNGKHCFLTTREAYDAIAAYIGIAD